MIFLGIFNKGAELDEHKQGTTKPNVETVDYRGATVLNIYIYQNFLLKSYFGIKSRIS